MKRKVIISIIVILLIIVGTITITVLVKKNNETSPNIEQNNQKNLILTIESRIFKCPSPTLIAYDNGTYEYYYTYTKTEDNKKPTPKTGTYNYDINKIINNLNEKNKDKYPGFEVKYNNKTYELNENNKFLNEFLKSININIHRCIEIEN